MLRFSMILVVALIAVGTLRAQTSGPSISEAVDQINHMMTEAWQRDGVTPAAISSDAEFCRRVWLDLAGVAPPVSQLRRFLDDTHSDKRQALIDQILVSPHHASHMAATWNDILLPSDAQSIQQRQNVTALENWLRDQFIDNTPYDYFVASFLTAGGAADRGPAIFYTTREVEPKKIAAATSKIFLGIQLQCAECHDHPFDRWTQEDFWSYAAFFGQLQQSDQQFNNAGFIIDRPNGDVTLPESDTVIPPRYPGATNPPDEDITNNRRRQLTIWLASRDNHYFVRAAINRAWAHLFGRGLVDPVDAMDKDNPPSHPEILDYLTEFFIQHRFDMRTLLTTLARTDAYQLSSAILGEDRPPPESFAAMTVKTLTARQFYDSVQQNLLRRSPTVGADGFDFQREQFLNRMRATDTTPRDYPHGVMQALGVMNGPKMTQATSPVQSGLLASLEAPFFSPDDQIETLFLATLSRMPTGPEINRIHSFRGQRESDQERAEFLSDVLWTLLNTAEAAVCP
ncbi:MAG: DUF1549 domain-containing protein [Pirellulaceae bacterium]|nr:DUF1549 domain-containing protein [Pirellulaceae bacterium]